MKKQAKALSLNLERLRTVSSRELSRIGGGIITYSYVRRDCTGTSDYCPTDPRPEPPFTFNGCNTYH